VEFERRADRRERRDALRRPATKVVELKPKGDPMARPERFGAYSAAQLMRDDLRILRQPGQDQHPRE
jgi:hypothetical protein